MKIEEENKIQGQVHTIKLQQFNKISKILVSIELINDKDFTLVRKWITEPEKIILDTIKINSKLEVIGRMEYDSYLKQDVMYAQKINQI